MSIRSCELILLIDSDVFYILFHFLSICSIEYQERSIQILNCNCGFLFCLFQFYQFLLHIVYSSVFRDLGLLDPFCQLHRCGYAVEAYHGPFYKWFSTLLSEAHLGGTNDFTVHCLPYPFPFSKAITRKKN